VEFEIIRPYLTWIMTVMLSFSVIVYTTTDIARRRMHRKIKKAFPLLNGPLTKHQAELISKKVELDLKILMKDLRDWERARDERKITQCKIVITNIQEIYYLTKYKLLTNEQVKEINNYMLTYRPVWNKTEVERTKIS